MGGPCEFKLYSASKNKAHDAFKILELEVRRIESRYSRYNADSLVSKINQTAGTNKTTKIDAECAGLIHYADQLFQQSDGLFDATSGVLRRVWNFKSNKLPDKQTINEILPLINWRNVQFNDREVLLIKKGMEIDFGGFGKEFATDLCAVKAQELGFQHGIINLGGDIRLVGPHPDGQAWKVGIQHPRHASIPIAEIDMHKGAIATSGDYERFMIISGRRYCHLLNPTTGMSIQPHYASVSVAAEACLIAGSFSTLGMLHSVKKPAWISDIGLPYLTVDQSLGVDGTIAR